MNTFLQGCCFIAPEDDSISTPSFIDRTPRFLPSSRSLVNIDNDVNFPESKEIFYIKRFPAEAWADSEDEKTCTTSTSFNAFSCTSKNTSHAELKKRIRISSSKRSLKANEDNVSEHMSYWLCGTNAQHSKDCYMSTYGSKSPRHIMTSTSRLLDLISMCFWKCSPGCQQIPTINV